jgi:ribonuclease E
MRATFGALRSLPTMAKVMLIDATHPEETRVVVVRGHRVEEFYFETAQPQQLRAKI